MKINKILYTSAEVRKTIIEIFSKSKGRRVAITAFVGSGAEAYLPKPKGIELICWPKAGGTNPEAIRKLLKVGAKVRFADALHMKVYWTEDKGIVITSANLSINALGSGNLREICILVPSNILDIDKIIRKVKPRRVTKQELDQLEIGHRDYYRSNKITQRKFPTPSFLDWFESPMRSNWKIGYWDATMQTSQATKRKSNEQYNVSSPRDFIGCDKHAYDENDWILTFRIRRNMPVDISWQFVDFVVETERKDIAYDPDFPYQAVQVWPLTRYSEPPFDIRNKHFRTALAIALKKYGIAKFDREDPSAPPKHLIELIRKNY